MKPKVYHLPVFAFVALGSFLLMFWITANGPGVSPDSTGYLDTVRSLLAGTGFMADGNPMIHYAPAYPLLLAIMGTLFQADLLHASRLLNALLYAVNIILIGFAAYKITARSLAASGLAMLLFLFSTPAQTAHAMVWSEPAFITFSLLAFILLSSFLV